MEFLENISIWDETQLERFGQLKRRKVMISKANGHRHKEGINPSPEYFSGYTPRNIESQIGILREFFPRLEKADISITLNHVLPPGAEGWFAIPRWEKIASTYNEALENMLQILKLTHNNKFLNWREGYIGPDYLREHEKACAGFQKLANWQAGKDILIIPAQFGLYHVGHSSSQVHEILSKKDEASESEFGLGSFAISCMLLTHRERLKHENDLWINCIGDQYRSQDQQAFLETPGFRFADNMLKFGAVFSENIDKGFSAPTGFLIE